MANNHVLKIWRVSNQSLVASVTVTPSSPMDSLNFKYELLGTPVTLNTDVAYRISSEETSGGDCWKDYFIASGHSDVASISGVAWINGTTYPEYGSAMTNQVYVPVTFYWE